jgi:hypothetical protein
LALRNASIGFAPADFGTPGFRSGWYAHRSSGLYVRLVHSGERPPLVFTVTPPGVRALRMAATRSADGHGAPPSIQVWIAFTSVAASLSFALGGMAAKSASVRVTAR